MAQDLAAVKKRRKQYIFRRKATDLATFSNLLRVVFFQICAVSASQKSELRIFSRRKILEKAAQFFQKLRRIPQPTVMLNSVEKYARKCVLCFYLPAQHSFSFARKHNTHLEHRLSAYGEAVGITVCVNLGESFICDFRKFRRIFLFIIS